MSAITSQSIHLSSKARLTARAMLCLLLFGLAAVLPRFARAAHAAPCSDTVLKSLGDYVGAARFTHPAPDGGSPSAFVQDTCKVWPADPKITLAVAAYEDEPQTGGDEIEYWDIVVAMVDTRTASIIAAYKGDGGEADAATRFGGYSLDTAAYQLAPGVRAFGVIDNSGLRGPDCADGGWGSDLTLWIRDKSKLRPVFTTEQDEWTTREGSACVTDEPGRIENAHMTIGVEKTRTKGFADLSLAAHVAATIWDSKHNDDVRIGTRRMTFKYDGKSYGDVPPNWWTTDK